MTDWFPIGPTDVYPADPDRASLAFQPRRYAQPARLITREGQTITRARLRARRVFRKGRSR